MGLERMAQVLQRVPNNYETDLMKPYLDETCSIAKIPSYESASEATKVSLKVIGDHIRAVVNLIADGVHVSNVGRGYILRRLIRRTVRHGRQLGIEKPFLKQLAQVAFSLSTEAGLVHITNSHKSIEKELETEELRFLDVLKKGEKRLYEILEMPSKTISGADAFELYDTLGFPLELTEEIAHEYGKIVDVDSFREYMEQQRMKARASQSFQSHSIDVGLSQSLSNSKTIFEGYHSYQFPHSRVTLLLDKEGHASVESASMGDEICVALDHTPFYAESGGQVADRGMLFSIDSDFPCQVVIHDVQKKDGIWLHQGKVESGVVRQNQLVRSEIDRERRNRLRVHHTATHLLHAALKLCIDKSISQAGSLVDVERLRFDFSCPRSLTEEDLFKLEDIINRWVMEGHDTQTLTMPYDEALQKGAIAMFNEKYESNVRVVDIPGVSMELCGGTHVENTREIGLFKITSESGIASGVRRIEAVAGNALMDWVRKRDAILSASSSFLHCTVEELPDRLRALQTQIKRLQQERQSIQMQLLSLQCKLMVSQARHEGNSYYLVSMFDTQDADQLRTSTQQICNTLGNRGIVVLLSLWKDEGKFGMCASVGKELVEKGLSADSIVKQVLQITGGRGGGKTTFAQGGGKSNADLRKALEWLDKTCKEALQKL
ncbi:Alanine--tRNA ligase [Galdieria sulphuraria]|nr:Alanine--tRNA ligase [Galdieria sulphuraria]